MDNCKRGSDARGMGVGSDLLKIAVRQAESMTDALPLMGAQRAGGGGRMSLAETEGKQLSNSEEQRAKRTQRGVAATAANVGVPAMGVAAAAAGSWQPLPAST